MGFGKPGEFDHGGCVIGAFLYDSYDIRAPRELKRRDGKFWTLYGCYPRQGGYEMRPGYEGVAASNDGLTWRRAKDQPTLAVSDADCGAWEKSCIYQPWLVESDGKFYDFYNAAEGGREQTGLAFSSNMLTWKRYSGNPVVRVRPKGYDEQFASDPKVFRDGDHWVMFYFGVGQGGAHVMAAFSRDLLHWTAHPEPLYKAGGHPSGLDKTYAHKISLVVQREERDLLHVLLRDRQQGAVHRIDYKQAADQGGDCGTTCGRFTSPRAPHGYTHDATGPGKPHTVYRRSCTGKQVLQFLPRYAGTEVAHALYLPTDWSPGKRFPVLIEYRGNNHRVKDRGGLGYGISGGKGFIWAVLPFVSLDHKQDMDWWWGDVGATVAYVKEAVPAICRQWGGDPRRSSWLDIPVARSPATISACTMTKSPSCGGP